MPGGGALTFLPLQRIETRINVLLGFLGAQPLPQQRRYGGWFGRDGEGGGRYGKRGEESGRSLCSVSLFSLLEGQGPWYLWVFRRALLF